MPQTTSEEGIKMMFPVNKKYCKCIFTHRRSNVSIIPIKTIYNTSLRSSFASDALTHSYWIMGVPVLT